MIEEPAFAFDPAAIALKRAVGSDHAMAWDDDRDSVFTIREPDRSRTTWIIELVSELAVGNGLSVWNREQCVPDLALPFGAWGIEGHRETLEITSEIGDELGLKLIEQ